MAMIIKTNPAMLGRSTMVQVKYVDMTYVRTCRHAWNRDSDGVWERRMQEAKWQMRMSTSMNKFSKPISKDTIIVTIIYTHIFTYHLWKIFQKILVTSLNAIKQDGVFVFGLVGVQIRQFYAKFQSSTGYTSRQVTGHTGHGYHSHA